jgi:hypothetical protein
LFWILSYVVPWAIEQFQFDTFRLYATPKYRITYLTFL